MLAFPPLDGAVGVAYTVVSLFTTAVTPVAGANATALAIVAFTVAVRLLLSPLGYTQVHAERRRTALAPRLRDMQHRCASEPARLREETMALDRSEGVNPLGGCLPALLQAPFFLVMYRLFTTPPAGRSLLGERLLGVPLGQRLGDVTAEAVPVFAVLFVLLAVLAWLTSQRMRRVTGSVEGGGPLAAVLPLFSFGTVVVAAFLPLAAGLYLVTTAAWTALEYAVLRR